MREFYIWICFLFITLICLHITNAADNVVGSTETNEIIPRDAIKNLDFSVRQALLRAIDRLEMEEKEKENQDKPTTESTAISIATTTQSSPITTKDEILIESVAPDDVLPTVQFFTASFDEKNSLEQPLSSFIDDSKVSKKTTKLIKQQKVLGAPVVVSENETFQPSNDLGTSLRSNEISKDQNDEIKFEIRSSKNVFTSPTTSTTLKPFTIKRKPRPTTTTTTTTTTPRPTHNEDGENIEVVDKKDIKIQEAPLVTAFTVDLDERGGTKTVVPLILTENSDIHQVREPTITKLNVLAAGQANSLFLPAIPPTQSTKLINTANNHFNTGIPVTKRIAQPKDNFDTNNSGTNTPKLNDLLLERQRQLEHQIYQLKLQAQQQQDLILRQLKILEQQSQIRNISPNVISSTAQQTFPLPTQFPQSFEQPPQRNQQEFGFTVRPSIEFVPSTHTRTISVLSPFSVEQQLPLNDTPNKFLNHHFDNNGINNNNVTPKPLLPIQTQQLPLNNPVHQNFQFISNSPVTSAPVQQPPTTVQIHQSNQLSFEPTFSPVFKSAETPIELSLFQPLPQHNYQQFQQHSPLVPSYVTNAVLQRQQLQHQQQQLQQQPQQPSSPRFFRQETGTANFGFNQIEVQKSNSFTPTNLATPTFDQQTIDNQNFYRQHLDPQLSNQLQQNAQQYYAQQQQQQQQQQHHNANQAVNHGVNAFGPHNPRLSGGRF